MLNFTFVSLIWGLVLITTAISCLKFLPKNNKLWRIIPRERIIGVALGFICLIFSAYHTYPLLEGNLVSFRNFLPVVVIIITVLSFRYLDYLFTRSLGGMMLLLNNWLVHEAFNNQITTRPLFSLTCYLIAICGFVMIASPYRFRDLLEKMTTCSRWRLIVASLLFVAGSTICLISISNYAL